MPSPWNNPLLFCCRHRVAWFLRALAAGSLLWGAFCLPALAASVKSPLPFAPGEEIRYEVRWQMYRAGEAWIRVLPFTELNGGTAWHFELRAQSNEFIDLFFRVRDHIQGFADDAFTGSVGYQYSGQGKKKKEIRVTFSPDRQTAAYSNFDERRAPIEIPPGCFDPLSSYFKMRCFSLGDTGTLSFPVTDGKKAFIQKGDIIGRERIVLKSGEYDTIVVSPKVTHFSGVFKKSKDPTVRVWISDDERKVPVRIRIKVVVGAIFFDLADYSPGG